MLLVSTPTLRPRTLAASGLTLRPSMRTFLVAPRRRKSAQVLSGHGTVRCSFRGRFGRRRGAASGQRDDGVL